MKHLKKLSSLLLVFVISFQIIFCVDAFAGVNEKIGGGGSSQSGSSGGDNFLIYVAAAAVVGLVVWKVISDKNKKAEAEKTDSTKAMILLPLQNVNEDVAASIRNLKDKIPVELTLGINSSNYFMNDKKVSVGLRYSF